MALIGMSHGTNMHPSRTESRRRRQSFPPHSTAILSLLVVLSCLNLRAAQILHGTGIVKWVFGKQKAPDTRENCDRMCSNCLRYSRPCSDTLVLACACFLIDSARARKGEAEGAWGKITRKGRGRGRAITEGITEGMLSIDKQQTQITQRKVRLNLKARPMRPITPHTHSLSLIVLGPVCKGNNEDKPEGETNWSRGYSDAPEGSRFESSSTAASAEHADTSPAPC